MNKLILHNISCKNFLRYGDSLSTIDVESDALSLIVGKNGSGKSSLIIDALFYNWFGKPFREMKIAKLVNSVNNKEMLTQSYVTSVENKKYKIVRGRKKDIFELYEVDSNGKEVLIPPPADSSTQQKFIEENILQMSPATFKQIVVLGSTSYIPFMQLKTADRRVVVEDLLSLNIYSYMNVTNKEIVKNLKIEQSKIQTDFYNFENILKIHKQNLNDIQSKSKNFVTDNQSKIDSLIQENQKLNDGCLKINNRISENNKLIVDKDEKKSLWQQLKFNSNNIEIDVKKLNERLKFYTENKNCSECGQDLDAVFVFEKKKNLNSEIFDFVEKQKENATEIENVTTRLHEIKGVIDNNVELNNKLSQVNMKISENNRVVDSLQQNINSFNNQDTSQVEAKIKDSQKNYNESKEKLEKVESDLLHHNALGEMLKDGSIKRDIISDYIPVINKLISDYLAVIGFSVNFTLDADFKETIVYNGNEFEYSSLSNGQKLRINIVLLFVLREVARLKSSATCNLLVLDEVLDSSLDSEGIDAIFKLLKHVQGDSEHNSSYVISHDVDATTRFKKVYNVNVDAGFSKITQTVTT